MCQKQSMLALKFGICVSQITHLNHGIFVTRVKKWHGCWWKFATREDCLTVLSLQFDAECYCWCIHIVSLDVVGHRNNGSGSESAYYSWCWWADSSPRLATRSVLSPFIILITLCVVRHNINTFNGGICMWSWKQEGIRKETFVDSSYAFLNFSFLLVLMNRKF